jgi:serine/threonine protein kinase
MHDRTFILCATVLLRALASRFSDALDNEVALSIAQRTSEDSDSPLPSTGNTDRVIKVSSYGKSDVLNLLEAPFSRLRSVTGLYIPISPHFNGKSCTSRDFRILHPIGKGSSSIVYLAEHLSNNGQQVVIKEYSKIYSLTNLEEIRMEEIVLKLNHPNLLKGICTYMENGIVKIVTEYPASRTIASAMKNGMLNNLEAQRGFVQQMAEVLKYLHGLDLIHNDIKPDNILIDDNHEITLIDFGYATRKMFESSNICGSPLYMSFTKLQGYSFDNGEDWYGLGTILYEIISGTHPFGDPKTLLALKKAMNAPVAPLLDADANDFVSMLRHFDPSKRWCYANRNLEEMWNHPYLNPTTNSH